MDMGTSDQGRERRSRRLKQKNAHELKHEMPDGPSQPPKMRARPIKRQRLTGDHTSCSHCAGFDLVKAWDEADDFFTSNWDVVLRRREWSNAAPGAEFKGLHIRDLPSAILDERTPSCAVCRFLRGVFEEDPMRNRSGQVQLRAFPLYWAVPFLQCTAKAFPAEMRHGAQPAVMCVVRGHESTRAFGGVVGPASIFRPMPGLSVPQAKATTPTVDWRQAKSWINFCQSNHTRCSKSNAASSDRDAHRKSLPGFRLIDCQTGHVVPATLRRTYVALSYVWGAPRGDAGGFPQVVKDAIEATKRLGFKHLWVDRYCIDQDNSEEKHQQIASMNIIYRHAELTIVDSAGRDAHHGLMGVSQPRETPRQLTSGSMHLVTVPISDARFEIRFSLWWNRGWTYQEGVLSRRRLCFTRNQLYYECACMEASESFEGPLELLHTSSLSRPRRFMRPGLFAGEEAELDSAAQMSTVDDSMRRNGAVLRHAENFSHREFTYGEDTLDAFRGILSANGVRSLAGLVVPLQFPRAPYPSCNSGDWAAAGYQADAKDIATSLVSWTHAVQHHGVPKRTEQFPSWGWLGWRGRIRTRQVSFHSPLSLTSKYSSARSEPIPTMPILHIVLESTRVGSNDGDAIRRLRAAGRSDLWTLVSPYLLMTHYQCLNVSNVAWRVKFSTLYVRSPSDRNSEQEMTFEFAFSIDVDETDFALAVDVRTWKIVPMARTAEHLLCLVLRPYEGEEDRSRSSRVAPSTLWERIGTATTEFGPFVDFAESNGPILETLHDRICLV